MLVTKEAADNMMAESLVAAPKRRVLDEIFTEYADSRSGAPAA